MRLSPWIVLALFVVLLWSLLPIYWFAKIAFLTPDEIARFPPPLCAARADAGRLLQHLRLRLHDWRAGSLRRASGQAHADHPRPREQPDRRAWS